MLIAADCDRRAESQSCSPWYIAGRLGQRERSGQWILREIQKLIDHAAFPPPIVQLDGRGQPITILRLSSRWQRVAVDAWFDGQPSARLAIPLAKAAADTESDRLTLELAERGAAMAREGRL